MELYFDIALIVIFAFVFIFNLARGFIKALKPFKKWAALVIAWMLKTPIANFVGKVATLQGIKKDIYDRAYSMWGDKINSVATSENGAATEAYEGIFGFLENLLSGLRDVCVQAVTEGISDVAHTVSVFVSESITHFILQAIAFIGGFIILYIVFSIGLKVVDVLCDKTALGSINRLFGGVLGVVCGFIIVWVISLVAFLAIPDFVGKTVVANWLAKSFFLSSFFGIG